MPAYQRLLVAAHVRAGKLESAKRYPTTYCEVSKLTRLFSPPAVVLHLVVCRILALEMEAKVGGNAALRSFSLCSFYFSFPLSKFGIVIRLGRLLF